MSEQEKVEAIVEEEKIMTEEKVVGEIEEKLVCPIDAKPWDESACAVIERRVVEQVLKRLQAEQSPEAAAPAAEIAGEESLPTAEPESGDELAKATEEEPKEV